MMKKKMAHIGEIGSFVMASGYAMNARPGPAEETLFYALCVP